MVANAVLDNIKRITQVLIERKCARASCETSWGKQRDLANDERVSGIEFTAQDEKDSKAALAGYDRDIADIEQELKQWHEALGHALDSLEGRV